MRRRAFINVTPELLEQMFVKMGMPDDIHFVGAKPPTPDDMCLKLYFDSDEFGAVPEGAMAPCWCAVDWADIK